LHLKLPAGFVDFDRGTVRVIATSLELEEMVGLLTGSTRDLPAEPGAASGAAGTRPAPAGAVVGGRGGTRRLVLAGGKVVYLRRYLRGGLAARFVRDLYLLRPERPLRELVITETARAAGCPVPTVLAVSIEEAGLFYRGWIVTEAIDGASALIDRYGPAGPGERAGLLRGVGAAFRSLHEAGVYHVDLTGHNVLIRVDGELVIIDFDRGILARPRTARLAGKGLDRFWRSMTKLCAARGERLDDTERRWLERGYER